MHTTHKTTLRSFHKQIALKSLFNRTFYKYKSDLHRPLLTTTGTYNYKIYAEENLISPPPWEN